MWGLVKYAAGSVMIASALLAGCAAPPEEGAAPPTRAEVGETIYRQYCFSCHASGINGAPRTGDTQAWAALAEKGEDALLKTTKEGILPFMPEMGLCLNCTDDQLLASIEHMMMNDDSELQ